MHRSTLAVEARAAYDRCITDRALLIRLATIATVVVAFTMTAASVTGAVGWRAVYPGVEVKLVPLFVGQDVLNLIVGVPMLLVPAWAARRGSYIGLVLWPGAFLYVVYDYAYYALGAPFNAFFIPYLLLVTVSAYAAVAVVVSVDRAHVRALVTHRIPARTIGAFLVSIAGLFTLLWTAISVSASLAGETLDMVPRVVTTLDLTIQLPALLTGGVLLLRRHALGYVLAPGLLLQAATYLIGLSALTALTNVLTSAPVDLVGVLPGLVIGALSLFFIGLFVRAAAGQARSGRTPIDRVRAWEVSP